MVKTLTLYLLVFLMQLQFSFGQSTISRNKPINGGAETLLWTADWSADDKKIAVGGDDSLLRIYDTKYFKLLKAYQLKSMIRQVSWHPSGDFFASGDYGHEKEGIKSIIQFWKSDGTLTKTIYGSKAEYRNIRWNKSGTILASASDALRIWNANGKLLFTGKSKDLLWGLDWNSKSEKIITSSITGKIKIWDANAKLITEVSDYKHSDK